MAIPQQPGECKPEDYHFGGAHTLRPFATVPSSPRCLASPLSMVRHGSCNPITSHVREAAVGGFHASYAAIVSFLVPEPPEFKSKQL